MSRVCELTGEQAATYRASGVLPDHRLCKAHYSVIVAAQLIEDDRAAFVTPEAIILKTTDRPWHFSPHPSGPDRVRVWQLHY